jgi:hypothetical protein
MYINKFRVPDTKDRVVGKSDEKTNFWIEI